MILINKGANPLCCKGYFLPKNKQTEIPDEIAKELLEIKGVEKYIAQADLEKAAKEAEDKVKAELEALKKENADLKKTIADLEKAAKEAKTSKTSK